MNASNLSLEQLLTVSVALTVILMVVGLVAWGVLAAARRRMLSRASGLENLDPLKDLLEKNKGALSEEEQRRLRHKLAERMLGDSREDRKT